MDDASFISCIRLASIREEISVAMRTNRSCVISRRESERRTETIIPPPGKG
jgi:hypothetical protein